MPTSWQRLLEEDSKVEQGASWRFSPLFVRRGICDEQHRSLAKKRCVKRAEDFTVESTLLKTRNGCIVSALDFIKEYWAEHLPSRLVFCETHSRATDECEYPSRCATDLLAPQITITAVHSPPLCFLSHKSSSSHIQWKDICKTHIGLLIKRNFRRSDAILIYFFCNGHRLSCRLPWKQLLFLKIHQIPIDSLKAGFFHARARIVPAHTFNPQSFTYKKKKYGLISKLYIFSHWHWMTSIQPKFLSHSFSTTERFHPNWSTLLPSECRRRRWVFVRPSPSSPAHTTWLSTCRLGYCVGRLTFIDRE